MATRTALKSLTLTAFRGSTTTFKLDFEKNTKLTLIYGENGTGKTTICDAFEFLSREKIGSLENRGMGSGLTKFWPTAGKSPSAPCGGLGNEHDQMLRQNRWQESFGYTSFGEAAYRTVAAAAYP